MNLIQRTIISTTLARIPLKKWSSPHTQKKNLKCSTWLQYQEQQNDLCSLPRKTIQYHSNPSLRPNHYSQRSWSWMVLWRPTRHSRTNTKERCAFHHRGLECKSRKLRDTWITGKIGLGVQNEAGQSLSEFHQENTLITANTFQQHKRDSTHGHHQMTNTESRLIIFFSAKNGEALYCQHKQDWSWLWLR